MSDKQSASIGVRSPSTALGVIAGVFLSVVAAVGIYLAAVKLGGVASGVSQESHFSLWVFLLHLLLGLLLAIGGILYAIHRKAYGWVAALSLLTISGIVLWIYGRDLSTHWPLQRRLLVATHWGSLLLIIGLAIKGRFGVARFPVRYLGLTAALLIALGAAHLVEERSPTVSPPEEQRFFPALTRTSTGETIPAHQLMKDEQCRQCHTEAHREWADSAHRFSSFNNPAYLAAVRETRDEAIKKDGHAGDIRFCAGCHDPVAMLSGALDQPDFNDQTDPTAHAGITCTVCHAITSVGEGEGKATRGNGDYVIAAPVEYPLAGFGPLDRISRQLILTKPAVHKETFLKPVHHTTEICGSCHKVHLPEELNDYKFLRGQNHYDSFVQSGVSGFGARSFYYPELARDNCASCHMPPTRTEDLGANDQRGRNHRFAAANTALPVLTEARDEQKLRENFLRETLRVDLFGIREEGRIDGRLHAPLRPEVPTLQPGAIYLLEAVIRNLSVGHHFTQGTADSNQIWLEVAIKDAGGRLIGQSGALNEDRRVDPGAYFVNAFIIDREGYRISRRNAQDIFVPLYNHQIPPGAARTVHYAFRLPSDVTGPLTIEAKLRYRKFDREFMEFVAKKTERAEWAEVELPIVDIAQDRLELNVDGGEAAENGSVDIPEWMRWNDYGIGLLLNEKSELRQAEAAFSEVERLGSVEGLVNLTRVYLQEGRLEEAGRILELLQGEAGGDANWWTVDWLESMLQHRLGNLAKAESLLRGILEGEHPDLAERGFNFSRDYVLLNQLGTVLFERSRDVRTSQSEAEQRELLQEAAEWFQRALVLDPENVTAHFNLGRIHAQLGNVKKAQEHQELHQRYKPDDAAIGVAVRAARERYPAANHAAGEVVIYDLHRSPPEPSAGQ